MDPYQTLSVVLDIDQMRALCDKWLISYEARATGTLAIAETVGPIDPDKLPAVLEARSDIQLLLSTYMGVAHMIIQILRGEED